MLYSITYRIGTRGSQTMPKTGHKEWDIHKVKDTACTSMVSWRPSVEPQLDRFQTEWHFRRGKEPGSAAWLACKKGTFLKLNGTRRSTYFCTKRAKCCVAPRHQIRPWPFATYCFSFPGNLQRHRWKISFLSIFNSTAWSRCVTKTFKPQSLSSPLLQDTPHSLPVCCILRTHHWACPCYSWIDPGWLLHIACCKNIKKHQPLCKSSLSLLSSLGTYSKQRPILLRTTTLVCKARDKLKCFEQHHASATQPHAQVHTGFVNLPHSSEGDHLKPAWFTKTRCLICMLNILLISSIIS